MLHSNVHPESGYCHGEMTDEGHAWRVSHRELGMLSPTEFFRNLSR